MGKKKIHGGLIISGTIPSGSGHDLVTISEAGVIGKISGTPLTTTLTAAQLIVGNSSNVATATAITGDVTINSSGVTAIATGVIVNADIKSDAAIALSKLAALTASRALVSDGSGVVSVSDVTSTEISYLDGVTSAIQTQFSGKQATITGGATTITSSNLTANRALLSNGSGKVAVSSVTNTELGYVSGVTSAIQTQINTKLGPTISSVAEGDILMYNGSTWVNLARGTNGQTLRSSATTIEWDTPTINGIPVGGDDGQVLTKQSGDDYDADWETLTVDSITDLTATAAELNVLDGITATVTELNYVDGASSNLQTQIDGKLSTTLPQNALFYGNSSNIATALSAGTNGHVLTSVSGVPTWQASSAGSPPGSDTQVIFNDGGSFGADSLFAFDKTNNFLGIGTGTPDRPIHAEIDSSATATVTYVARLTSTSSGTPATGIGVGLEFEVETAAGNNEVGATVEVISTDVTSTSEDFDLVFKTMAAGSAADEKLRVTSDGRIYGTALHNNAGAITGTTNQYVASGTYTPDLTNVSNLDGSTAYTCQWMRVGNVVTVSGKVDIDPTTAAALNLGISLPIASDLSSVDGEQCAGAGNTSAASAVAGAIYGDSTNDRANLSYVAVTTGEHSVFFTFTYLVI